MSNEYVEIVQGSLTNRGSFIAPSQIKNYLKPEVELYKSYFSFDEKIKEHIQAGRKTASGFIGNFYLRTIILDIDKKSDTLEYLLTRVRNIVDRLIKDFDLLEENIALWFSGNGIHIQIPDVFGFTPSNNLPQIVKATIERWFPEADTKPVNPRGLIRVPFSYNPKSGLYKTNIPTTDIWFIASEKILEMAKKFEPKTIKYNAEGITTNAEWIVLPQIKVETEQLPSQNPNNIVTCMQLCYNEGEKEGTRHERLLRMVSWQRRSGTPANAIIPMMKAYAPSVEPYEIEKIVIDTYNKGYQYGCNDVVMKHFCDSRCIFHKNKDYAPNIVTSGDMEKAFGKYVKGDWKARSFNLKNFFMLRDDFWIEPGLLCTFIGGTGLNKTSLLQNLIVNERHLTPILYLSTEFGNRLLFRRFIQIAHAMGKEEVMEYYQTHTNHLSNSISHIHYLNAIPNAKEIEKLVVQHQPRIVVIDVIDDISYPNMQHGVASQEMMAAELKQLAEKHEVILLLVHHIKKSDAFDDRGNPKELTVHSGKGSSAIEQKSDLVIGIEGKATDNKRIIKSLKSRDNEPFVRFMEVDVNTFIFSHAITEAQ